MCVCVCVCVWTCRKDVSLLERFLHKENVPHGRPSNRAWLGPTQCVPDLREGGGGGLRMGLEKGWKRWRAHGERECERERERWGSICVGRGSCLGWKGEIWMERERDLS